MYILKNAWLNITKNKGRNILIGCIIFIISCALTITLAIKNTASSLIKSYKDAYRVETTIGFNRQSMKENFDFTNQEGMNSMKDAFSNVGELTKEDIDNYADSEYVKDYYYTYSVSVNSDDIEPVSSDFSFGGRGGKDKNPDDITNFTLMGYSSVDSMSEFINGSYTMSDVLEDAFDIMFDGNYCLINEELASLNDISLGDEISFSSDVSLTVVGIFSEKDDESMNMFSASANTIITNVNVIDSIHEDNTDLRFSVNPTFILDSYSDIDAFSKELYEKGLNEYFSVTTNEEEVSNATSSVSNVLSFAATFLVLTLIIGAFVLLIINQINIRERKYEIGVLRTIGMKKSLLTLQFLIELTIVAFIFLIMGAFAGSLLSRPVSNKLLQNEIESSKEAKNEMNENFGGHMMNDTNHSMNKISGVVNIEAYDSIDAIVDFKVIIELVGICLVLILVGSLTAIVSIQRFSPLEILKERS